MSVWTPCNVVSLSTTNVNSNTSPLTVTVTLMRKDTKRPCLRFGQDDLRSPTQTEKRKTHPKRVVRSWLSYCGSIVTLQVSRVSLVQPIQSVLLLVYQHSQVLGISLLSRFVVASICGLFQVIATVRPIRFTLLLVAHCLPLCFFFFCLFFFFSRHGPFIVPSAQSTVPTVSLCFAPVSTFPTNSVNCLFISVFHIQRRLDSTDVPSS